MNVVPINELDIESIKCTGNKFVSFSYEDGTNVYFKLPELLCPYGINIQEYNGTKKAYLTFMLGDTEMFNSINTLLHEIAKEKFPDADVLELGNDGQLKIKVELKGNGELDASIYNSEKQCVNSDVLVPGCSIISICQLRGCWSMNGKCSIAIKAEQMRVWPPKPVERQCLIDSEEDEDYASSTYASSTEDSYVPFKSNCLIEDE